MVNLRQALQPNKRAAAVVIAGGLLFACGEANIETTLPSDSSVALTIEDTTPAELTPVEPPPVEPIPVTSMGSDEEPRKNCRLILFC